MLHAASGIDLGIDMTPPVEGGFDPDASPTMA